MPHPFLYRSIFTLAAAVGGALPAMATVVTIPQSALTPLGQYYTDSIGGGIGSVVVTTGGGNAANIDAADGRNDDGFSGPINFGYSLDFFGSSYTSFYANNNGNVSFGAGISAYVPTGPTGALSPVISAWFGDVDTRNSASGVLHIRQDIANQTILTWDNVGYYNNRGDLLNSFQMVIRGPGYDIPVGEGTIGFFYKDMQWEATQTSQTAAIGFGDGAGNAQVLAGSTAAGLANAVSNQFIWFDQNLNVVPNPAPGGGSQELPEPGSGALLLLGLGTLAYIKRHRR